MKTGILVVNLGTPNSSKKKDVARYLREFLIDGRVIDIPFWKRWLLVNLIIVPVRVKKVSGEYEKLWLKEGSSLMVYGHRFAEKLQSFYTTDKVKVVLAMRYQQPSIEEGLDELRNFGAEEIVVFSMFPQYASATTGSVTEKIMNIVAKWNVIPVFHFINSYHNHLAFIRAFADKLEKDIENYKPDHVLFSYHGIPERQLAKVNEGQAVYCSCTQSNCGEKKDNGQYCYRAACFETSQLISRELDLPKEKFTTSFQSRLGKDPWIRPYTDQKIIELRKQGIRKLLVVSPSFVADCLETTQEIGEQYHDLFMGSGGQAFHYTTSLNDDNIWVRAALQIIGENSGVERSIEKHITASYKLQFPYPQIQDLGA